MLHGTTAHIIQSVASTPVGYVDTAGAVGNNTGVTVIAPSYTGANFLLAFFSFERTGDFPTTPTGLTVLDNAFFNNWGRVYYRVLTGSDPASYAFSYSTPNEANGAIVMTFSGVDTSDPFDADEYASEANEVVTTHSCGSVETSGSGRMVVSFIGVNDNVSATNPTGYTETYDAGNNSASSGIQVASAYDADVSTGSYSPTWTTGTSEDSVWFTIALKPS